MSCTDTEVLLQELQQDSGTSSPFKTTHLERFGFEQNKTSWS